MSRMTWLAPEGRFFDAGIDRGVLYPKGEAPPGPILTTNGAKVPRPVAVTGYVAAGPATVAYDPSVSGIRVNVAAGGSTTAGVKVADGYLTSVTPGEIWLYSIEVTAVLAGVLNLTIEGKGVFVLPPSTFSAGQTKRLTLVVTHTGSGAGPVDWFVYRTTGILTEFIVRKAMQIKVGSMSAIAPVYFDGETEDTYTKTYSWVGAANASQSVERERMSLAVPWVGLTGVEEKGGDGAAAYYIDGRPFLFLPKPKEYQSTLKAFTYPDAFAQIMGITEVADGMYLDSQPGEAFDLSYRTLVGNATQGVDHGYKIHLVYNAVVTPQSLSYDTLGNSINPVEFSWDIQAVPVRVEGFRPTAHIIIDTRHMDPAKIAAIEGFIYGDEDHVPNMPTPQVIFDLLSYGDTIIVTDMGDGTFTVDGSYENVYMINPGEFRVDNVDGTDHGDGTFTISSTNV